MKLSRLLISTTLGVVTLVVIILAAKLAYNQYRVTELTLATASKQGDYYAFGQALATVVQRHYPRLRLRVLETKGSRENMQLLARNQVQLAIVQSDTPGDGAVRSIAALFPEVFHLLAKPRSGIETVPDLKGKRIALMPKGSGSYTFFWLLMQHYGISPKEIQTTALPPDLASEQFQQGRFDALFRSIALGSQSMRSLIQSTNATLVPIDQVPALQLEPSTAYIEPIQLPRGAYSGNPATPAQPLPAASVQAMFLSHKSVDDSVINSLMASLYEHRNELVSLTPRATTIAEPKAREGLGLPLHPAARLYYNQDQPSFLEQYAEAMGFLLSLGILSASAFWNLRNHFQNRQKNRGDRYNLQVLELTSKLNTIEDSAQLDEIQKKLFEIFQQAVEDLDNDRISAETFHAFSIPWQVAITSIRHRETLLQQQHFFRQLH